MSAAPFAPAPWTAHESCGGMAIRDAHDWVIANVIQRDAHPVHGGEITRAQCAAHARLVIAAPKLADLLSRVVQHNLAAQFPAFHVEIEDALRAAGVPT